MAKAKNLLKPILIAVVVVAIVVATVLVVVLSGKDNGGHSGDTGSLGPTVSGSTDDVQGVSYAVSFYTHGGSTVPSQSIKDGECAVKPADPVRANYVFVGWYVDSDYTVKFDFGTPITDKTELHARWEQSVEYEFTVVYDLNYDGLVLDTVSTIGGKLHDLPVPERSGYTFNGWWVSMYDEAEKLSYKYEEEMSVAENMSLYALWTSDDTSGKLSAPVVTVEGDKVVWTGVENASRYSINISGPEGYATVNRSLTQREYNAEFATAPEGDYVITVTALSNQEANNSEATVRYYKNKALADVSIFQVTGETILMYNGVDKAEKYYISIDCGVENHQHVDIDNGTSTTYDFANCDMKEDGITFTVKAVAEGYVASSASYVLKRNLNAVTGLNVDAATATVSWNAVEKAKEYVVTVKSENGTQTANVSDTSYSLATYGVGEYTVEVYPKAKLYNAPEATVVTYNKNTIAAPSDVVLSGNTLTWNMVDNVEKYIVKIGDKVFEVSETSFELESGVHYTGTQGSVEVSVQAVSSDSNYGDSVYSTVTTLWFGSTKVEGLEYNSGYVTWDPVIKASKYEVKVNDGTAETVSAGESEAEVAFTKDGVNTVSVRYYTDSWSDWAVIDVRVYKITFETNGGDDLDPVYLAEGDVLNLPEAMRSGYTMVGWFNSPDGNVSGSEFVNGNLFEGRNTTLYATWRGKTYTIFYNYGGKEVVDGATEDNAVYNESYSWGKPVSTDGAVIFAGWYSEPNGEGVQYTNMEGAGLDVWATPSDTTVYAYWATIFTFTLRSDGTYAVAKGPDLTYSDGITEITVPAKYKGVDVTSVAAYAFDNCSRLVTINIPDTIDVIETDTAFYRCKKLQAVNIYNVDPEDNYERLWSSTDGVLVYKDNVQGEYLLKFVPLLKTGAFTIPDGVTAIPLKAFSASLISEVTIPSSVVLIEESAFFNCANLTSVVFKPELEGEEAQGLTIRELAFQNCTALSEITLPARLAELSTGIFSGCNALANIHVEAGGTTYSSKDGNICSLDGKVLVIVPVAKVGVGGVYTIPEGVSTIGEKAFDGCYRIREVVIPAIVNSIQDSAFADCPEITKVTFLGGSIVGQEIGDYAFYNCKKLAVANFAEDCNVEKVGLYAFANTALTSLYIPRSLTEVHNYAFAECANLGSVTFAENGKEITFGSYVFLNCVGLTEVYLPASVKSFAQAAFEGCSNLANIFVDENSEHYMDKDGVLFSKDETVLKFYPIGRKGDYSIPAEVKVIEDRVFTNNQNITGVTIGLNINNIGANAFDGCFNLTELNIPDYTYDDEGNVVGGTFEELVIENGAFANCIRLESVILPKRVKTIVPSMFSGSSALKEVVINGEVTAIGEYAFANTAISTLDLPATVKTLGNYAFAGSEIVNIDLPATITSIGTYVFYGCRSLDTVSFAEGSVVTTIPQYAFANSSVEVVNVPASVTKIDNYAFNNAISLREVNFVGTSKLTTIGTYVFQKAYNLESFVLPDTVTSIGNYAFENTTSMTTFTINETSKLKTIGTYAFRYSAITSIFIPKNVTTLNTYSFAYTRAMETISFAMDGTADLTIGANAFNTSGIKEITFPKRLKTLTMSSSNYINQVFWGARSLEKVNVEDGCANFSSVDGILYSADKTAIWLCPEGKRGDIVIPSNVKVVKDRAFYQCSLITSVTFEELPDGVESSVILGTSESSNGYVFYKNYLLSEVKLPQHLTYIGKYSFSYCTALTEVSIPARVTKVDNGAFQYSGLESYTFETYADGSRDLTAIGNSSFGYCNLTYALVPKEITVLGSQVFAYDYSLAKVEFEEGIQLEEIGQVFTSTAITEITIPEGVQSIRWYCFGNTPLEKITLPSTLVDVVTAIEDLSLTHVYIAENHPEYKDIDGVLYNKSGDMLIAMPAGRKGDYSIAPGTTVVGGEAFRGSELTSVHVPASVVRMESCAFFLANVQEVTFEDGDEDLVMVEPFYYTGLKRVVIPKRVTDLGDRAFMYSYDLESVVFASGSRLTGLGNQAFKNCSSLTELVLPEKLTTIGASFDGCTSLPEVTLPDTLLDIPANAFNNCYSLTVVKGGKNLTSIGENAFANCDIREFTIPASLTTLGAGAFMGNVNLATLTIEEGCSITEIGANTFAGCAFSEIAIPDTVTSIGENAFGYATKTVDDVDVTYTCSNLVTANIPAGVTSIGKNAFYGAEKLTGVELPAGLTTLGDYAFYNCKALTSATIPGGVTDVGAYAFAGCAGITELNIREGVLTLGDGAFENCSSVTELYLPGSLATVGSNPFAGTGLTNPEIDAANTLLVYDNGALYDLDKTTLYAYLGDGSTEFVIPEGVSFIAPGAFANTAVTSVVFNNNIKTVPERAFTNATKLNKVVLTDSVTVISPYAFQGCTALANITLPDTLRTIGTYAFEGSGLTSIVITPYVTTLDTYAFANCESLVTVGFDNTGMEILNLANYAFYDCDNLTTVTIPRRVSVRYKLNTAGTKYSSSTAAIGSYCFAECDSLATVYFDGTGSKKQGPYTFALTLASNVFENCVKLEKVNFPEYLGPVAPTDGIPASTTPATFGSNTFRYCASLTEVTFINPSFTSLGSSMFDGCASLEKFVMPDTVTSASGRFFADCTSLKEVVLSPALTSIGESYFANTQISEIEIPDTVTNIGAYAFYNTKLVSVVVPSRVTYISNHAFAECKELTSVELPIGLERLGKFSSGLVENTWGYVFENSTNIKEIVIPYTVLSCQTGTFSGWTEDQVIKIMYITNPPKNWHWDEGDWDVGCNAKIEWGYNPYANN